MRQIRIVWGSDLTKIPPFDSYDHLFIWEESHFAQNVSNRPKKFMEIVGISPDGQLDDKYGNYCLSVSATPFSEMVDNNRHQQKKPVIYLHPGEGYNSVQSIMANGKLKTFTDPILGLDAALRYALPDDPKYAIIRCSNKTRNNIHRKLSEYNWKIVDYDTVSANKYEGEKTWKSMDKKPSQNTAILIRGRCRMGKNLDKSHLLFVFEPVTDTHTDTALQGLLGRVCGYSQGSSDVYVWVSEELDKSEELYHYMATVNHVANPNNPLVVPRRATNIVSTTNSGHTKYPILPIKIKLAASFISDEDDQGEFNNETTEYLMEPERHYIDQLRKWANELGPTPHNPQYNEFIQNVCHNAINQTVSADGIQYKCEVHDVCADLQNEAQYSKWVDITSKLVNTHVSPEQLNIPINSSDIICPEFIMSTHAKTNQVLQLSSKLKEINKQIIYIAKKITQIEATQSSRSADAYEMTQLKNKRNELWELKKQLRKEYTPPSSKREGYIVHLYVFTKNPAHMTFKDADTQQIVSDFYIEPNTMFLWGVTECKSDTHPEFLLVDTSKEEVFAHKIDPIEEDRCNGQFMMPFDFPTETSHNCELMSHYLRQCVESTYKNPRAIRKVTFDSTEQFKGILLKTDVERALSKGGEIFEHVKQTFKVTLKLKKYKGKQAKRVQDYLEVNVDLVRYETIEW